MKLRLFRRPKRITPQWVDYLAVVLISVAYVVVSSIKLGSESSYFDEGYTSYLARFSPLDIAHYTALDVHPPLYYDLLHFWQQIVGLNVFWLRFMSVIWGVIALVFIFLLFRKLFGRAAAVSSVGFVALSPLFIRYSEAMRMYTMALALVIAGTYVLVHTLQARGRRRLWLWLLYAAVVAAGMWTNYFTAFVWIAHLLWLLSEKSLTRKTEKTFRTTSVRRQWFIAIGVAILLYIPWLPWLITRFINVQATGFWIKSMSIDTIVSTITTATAYTSADKTVNWMAFFVVAYVPGALLLAITAYRSITSEQQQSFRLIALCALLPVALLILLSLPPFRSSYAYRYVLNGIVMTSALIGASVVLAHFKKYRHLKKALYVVVALVVLVNGVYVAKLSGNRNLDTGGITLTANAIWKINESSDGSAPIIIHSAYTFYAATLYETPDFPVYYTYSASLKKVGSTRMLYDHPEARGIKDLATFASNYSHVWFVAEDKYNIGPPATNGWYKKQSFILYDPVTKKPSSYAAEYARIETR